MPAMSQFIINFPGSSTLQCDHHAFSWVPSPWERLGRARLHQFTHSRTSSPALVFSESWVLSHPLAAIDRPTPGLEFFPGSNALGLAGANSLSYVSKFEAAGDLGRDRLGVHVPGASAPAFLATQVRQMLHRPSGRKGASSPCLVTSCNQPQPVLCCLLKHQMSIQPKDCSRKSSCNLLRSG